MNFPAITGIGTALPERCYQQEEVLDIFRVYLSSNPRTETIFQNAGVGSRYLAVDGTYYQEERTTQVRNERYMEEALKLGEQAIRRALAQAGKEPGDIDDLIIVSCTGIDTPGLDLRLAGQMGLSPWLQRSTVLGMGCYAAFPGLLRAADSVRSRPNHTALMLAVEICSLHFQPNDSSLENVVSSALFADGAAAVVINQDETVPGPHLVDSATYSDYQTFDHMAFHLTDHGFRMSLSAYVPKLLAANIEGFVDALLARNNLTRSDIRHWGVHPGSSKILDYTQERLGLAENALDPSRKVLWEVGNLSSATILFVLDEIQKVRKPAPGDYGVLMSFGPGLTMESALVQWR